MAIITEEPEEPKPSPNPKPTTSPKPRKSNNSTPKTTNPNPNPNTNTNTNTNPFIFWFYFTLAVSLITLLFVSFSSSFTPQDPKSWFLSLPNDLRHHYSKGRTIKVQTSPNHSPIEVFTIEDGQIQSENVVILHGLGLSSYSFRKIIRSLGSKGVRAAAIDLPGSGFSDKYTIEVDEGGNGVLERVWDVYSVIKEKGLFWAFDQIIETGQIPYEEIEFHVSNRKSVKVLELGPEEMGKVLGQVIDSMRLAPLHLVLHDSALGVAANWVSENSGLVRSVTLLDTSLNSVPALPLWVLEMPVIREFVLGFPGVYARVLNLCCSKSIGVSNAEPHRVLLKGKDGRRAAVGMAKKLNYSIDLAEWGSSEGLNGVPMQVLWSSSWSKEWIDEGRRIADAIPQARFVTHSGGRWPQEDAADELSENIVQFVSSLPKYVRQVEEEPVPEHIQKMFDEAKGSNHEHDHHHHHGHDGHDHHGHAHGDGFMDAYGLGHGWGS
ncbi:hypothetical protein L1049_019345 [Liquidambar formosana]|uniref:AB hydrolase-1 domain-containing protein n=1 Tax=Liquidambar formosana TaxID=63359 RepID=A0AAP0X963_LIQFO